MSIEAETAIIGDLGVLAEQPDTCIVIITHALLEREKVIWEQNRHLNPALKTPAGHMLTSLNGAGESGTVPAMNNPQVMAAMIGEINSFINFKLLTDSISPALSGEQVHYVVNSLSGVSQTADLENKMAQELSFAGVEGRLRIT